MKIVVIGAGPVDMRRHKSRQTWGKSNRCGKNELGGTCLNRGCMPTKSLLASSEVLTTVNNAENLEYM